MWDNAPLLRSIANTLIALSVLAVLYGAIYYAVHLPGLFPLRNVRLSDTPQRVDATDVLQVVRSEVKGNFFTVDIEHLRQALEKLPWVRSVSIRREFPYRLVVQLEEHQALARWNNRSLVNQHGEVFVAKSEQALPNFLGPEDTAADITARYTQFTQQLASLNKRGLPDCPLYRRDQKIVFLDRPLPRLRERVGERGFSGGRVGEGDSVRGTCSDVNLQAAQITLSPRRAWQLRLSNGMVLELGREDMQQRLARFVAVQRTEDGRQKTEGAMYVDLRYRNGFAVRQVTNVKE